MTFLPIADRELRVAARKRGTFWVRIVAAFVACVIAAGFFVLTSVTAGPGPTGLGSGLFGALTWLSLAAALSSGLFFTSDCLSEEKREGTLGFLFLTDLKGYDVVLGKLAATSLRGSSALLAVFPVLAITLLMGGVTGAQFWKTVLALANALFVSLAAGLFVSAISRDSQKALAGTLFLLVLLIAGGPAGDATIAMIPGRAFEPVLSLSSPGYLFVTAGAWGHPALFWWGLLANEVIAWTLLGLTCRVLPRAWQEKAVKTSVTGGKWSHWWSYGGSKRRAALRRTLMDVNPAMWLACRERWQSLTLWALTLLLIGSFVTTIAAADGSIWWMVWSGFAGVFTLVLYLGIASQAGRFFVDARRSGLIEQLLATPLTARQIVQGQWRAMLRMFGPPLALCLAAQLVGTFLVQHRQWQQIAAATATISTTAPAATTTTTANAVALFDNSSFADLFLPVAVAVTGTLTTVANLVALCWFGMWMGLISRTGNLATLRTILFVQIVPWFGIGFATMLTIPLLMWSGMWIRPTPASPPVFMFLYPVITMTVGTGLSLIKNLVFVLWARRKLYSEFRERASRPLSPIRHALPPPLPPRNAPVLEPV